MNISERLAQELNARLQQVDAAITLLDGGATVPFIARYRKEATGGLDDTQLRLLEERLAYLRELEERRAAIVASITEQGKMTPELLQAIALAEDKTRLEDLYLPYKQKRRTKAQIAIEAGLAPLADGLLADPSADPETEAVKYLREAFANADGVNNVVGREQRAIQPRERTAKRDCEGRCTDCDEDQANQESEAIGHQSAISLATAAERSARVKVLGRRTAAAPPGPRRGRRRRRRGSRRRSS